MDALGLDVSAALLSLTYADERLEATDVASLPDGIYGLASACGLAPAGASDDALRAAEVVWRRITGDDSEMFAGGPPSMDDAE